MIIRDDIDCPFGNNHIVGSISCNKCPNHNASTGKFTACSLGKKDIKTGTFCSYDDDNPVYCTIGDCDIGTDLCKYCDHMIGYRSGDDYVVCSKRSCDTCGLSGNQDYNDYGCTVIKRELGLKSAGCNSSSDWMGCDGSSDWMSVKDVKALIEQKEKTCNNCGFSSENNQASSSCYEFRRSIDVDAYLCQTGEQWRSIEAVQKLIKEKDNEVLKTCNNCGFSMHQDYNDKSCIETMRNLDTKGEGCKGARKSLDVEEKCSNFSHWKSCKDVKELKEEIDSDSFDILKICSVCPYDEFTSISYVGSNDCRYHCVGYAGHAIKTDHIKCQYKHGAEYHKKKEKGIIGESDPEPVMPNRKIKKVLKCPFGVTQRGYPQFLAVTGLYTCECCNNFKGKSRNYIECSATKFEPIKLDTIPDPEFKKYPDGTIIIVGRNKYKFDGEKWLAVGGEASNAEQMLSNLASEGANTASYMAIKPDAIGARLFDGIPPERLNTPELKTDFGCQAIEATTKALHEKMIFQSTPIRNNDDLWQKCLDKQNEKCNNFKKNEEEKMNDDLSWSSYNRIDPYRRVAEQLGINKTQKDPKEGKTMTNMTKIKDMQVEKLKKSAVKVAQFKTGEMADKTLKGMIAGVAPTVDTNNVIATGAIAGLVNIAVDLTGKKDDPKWQFITQSLYDNAVMNGVDASGIIPMLSMMMEEFASKLPLPEFLKKGEDLVGSVPVAKEKDSE